jgi:DNA-binding Lrp family transcriptional regulator
MDNLDAKIMREFNGPGALQWNVRQSYSTIATKLGADEETVRRRIIRMQQSGHLGGSELILNPYLINREPVAMELRVAGPSRERKSELISQIELIDGVVMIVDLQGDALQVLLFCEDEKAVSRRTRLLSSISGCSNPLIIRNMGFPHPDIKLSKTDWLILKSLRREPRRNSADIAKELRTSVRTVERRIGVLTENGAFFHMFRPDFRKFDGVAGSIIVSYEEGSRKSALDEAISSKLERVVFSFTASSTISQFNFVCDNLLQAEANHEWIQGLDGVSQASMGIVKGFILVTDWLDEEIDKRLQG